MRFGIAFGKLACKVSLYRAFTELATRALLVSIDEPDCAGTGRLRRHGNARVFARAQYRLGRPGCRRLGLVSILIFPRGIAQQQAPELLIVHGMGGAMGR